MKDDDLPLLVLIEVGCEPEGLTDPVVTKDERITNVQLDWREPIPPDLRDDAILALSEYEGEHPRIDVVLSRLRGLVSLEEM